MGDHADTGGSKNRFSGLTNRSAVVARVASEPPSPHFLHQTMFIGATGGRRGFAGGLTLCPALALRSRRRQLWSPSCPLHSKRKSETLRAKLTDADILTRKGKALTLTLGLVAPGASRRLGRRRGTTTGLSIYLYNWYLVRHYIVHVPLVS